MRPVDRVDAAQPLNTGRFVVHMPVQNRNNAVPMIRKAFRLWVHPTAHSEYERRHQPIWRELEDALHAHGVRNYSIFLDDTTSELFGYAEIESEERWAAIASTEVCRRWWDYMRDLMPVNPDHSPRSAPLREVFHID